MTLSMLFKRQWIREMQVCRHEKRHTLNAILFFLMVIVFFPLSMPTNFKLIQLAASGVLWISLLLSILLISERLFYEDVQEGVIEQWMVSGYPLTLFIYAKLLAQGLWLIIPLVLFSPFFAIIYSLPWSLLAILDLSFILGLPALLALGALANAFTQSLSQKGLLMALILLPLTLPILIFGSAILNVYQDGSAIQGFCALLLCFSILAFGLLPFAIAGVLKAQY